MAPGLSTSVSRVDLNSSQVVGLADTPAVSKTSGRYHIVPLLLYLAGTAYSSPSTVPAARKPAG
jgi:hypothetical protein